jgi:hypothetical protein
MVSCPSTTKRACPGGGVETGRTIAHSILERSLGGGLLHRNPCPHVVAAIPKCTRKTRLVVDALHDD